jgi:hypothetical protein
MTVFAGRSFGQLIKVGYRTNLTTTGRFQNFDEQLEGFL